MEKETHLEKQINEYLQYVLIEQHLTENTKSSYSYNLKIFKDYKLITQTHC